jgi:hypothetical protein
MRLMLIAVPLALLAACNSGSETPAADNAVNAAVPETAANASTSAANDLAASYPTRAADIQECIEDVRSELPEGADLNAFCGCAADRMHSSGGGERESMEACAAQMGIQPRQ